MIQKQGVLTMSEMLLQRQKIKKFLHRIVTGDEKWIHYDNPKRPKAWVKQGKPSPSMTKRNIHGSKILLCIWWDQEGLVYYELLQPNQIITAERYKQQLIDLSTAMMNNQTFLHHDTTMQGLMYTRHYSLKNFLIWISFIFDKVCYDSKVKPIFFLFFDLEFLEFFIEQNYQWKYRCNTWKVAPQFSKFNFSKATFLKYQFREYFWWK